MADLVCVVGSYHRHIAVEDGNCCTGTSVLPLDERAPAVSAGEVRLQQPLWRYSGVCGTIPGALSLGPAAFSSASARVRSRPCAAQPILNKPWATHGY